MKTLAFVAIAGIAAFALWKHHNTATAAAMIPTGDIPSGVSEYPSLPAPQLPQQVTAAAITNSDAVSTPGFSGAFGPYENQPGDGEILY